MGESTFTTHTYTINFEKYNEPVYLIPFGDIHRNAPLCHVHKWKEFLEWAKNKKRCYFLGMGDYNEMASLSERLVLRSPSLHESTKEILDKLYIRDTDTLVNEISFMGKNLIGVIEGNHHGELQSGITTTQYMAQKLGVRYLGVSSFIRLRFRNKEAHRSTFVDIWAHHGAGGGKALSGSINSVHKMMNAAIAHIYMMGHDHKKWTALIDTLYLQGRNTPKLRYKKILLCRTGSFLKGYEPDKDSYVAGAALQPTNLGVVKIELTPRMDCSEGRSHFYIDIHASI